MDWLGLSFNALQVASILATAGFAAFGLFNKYKDDDGRITRPGRIAVIGIALSALLSLGTQSVKAEVDRRKAKAADEKRQAELRAQAARFAQQARQLQTLDDLQRAALDGSRNLQGRVGNTLSRLQTLQGQVSDSISAIDAVGAKQDRYTGQMLRTMWYDANRISGSRLEMRVYYECRTPPGTSLPRLFPEGSYAEVYLQPRSRGRPELSGRFALEPALDEDNPSARATRQYFTQEPVSPGQAERHSIVFAPFEGHFSPELGNPDNWRDATLEMFVWARHPDLIEHLGPVFRLQQPQRQFRVPSPVPPPTIPVPLPCEASFALVVNGRMIAYQEAAIYTALEAGAFRRLVMKAPPKPVRADALPSL